MIDLDELERLADLVQNANISELTLKQGDARITIRKGAPAPRPSTALTVLSRDDTDDRDETFPLDVDIVDEDDSEIPAEKTTWVTAPLVGVYHHLKPLVGLGTQVTAGQVMGVIEAMKLITEITAETDGIVTDVLVEDGMAVEYGQPLFAVQG